MNEARDPRLNPKKGDVLLWFTKGEPEEYIVLKAGDGEVRYAALNSPHMSMREEISSWRKNTRADGGFAGIAILERGDDAQALDILKPEDRTEARLAAGWLQEVIPMGNLASPPSLPAFKQGWEVCPGPAGQWRVPSRASSPFWLRWIRPTAEVAS